MGGIFHYDADSGLGYYMDDKEIAEAGSILGLGIGAVAGYSVLVCIVSLIVIAPFFTLFVLDDFVETFIVNNAVFFVAMGVILTVLKLFTQTFGSRFVRILFDAYIIITVLYLTLYVLHFDIPIYSYFKIIDNYMPENSDKALIELWGIDNLTKATDENWFYELACNCVDKFIDFVKWAFTNVINIDNSCFSVPAGEINILSVLKTIGLYIAFGGFGIIVTFILGLLMIAFALITIVLPYVLAITLVITVNKFMYKICTAKIQAVKKDDCYETATRIYHEELNPILKFSKEYVSIEKAIEIYEKAAKAGNPIAQVCYAQCYLYGNGVLEDEKQSFYWYRQAALQGHTKGQIMTALAYFGGIGVKKNKVLAKAWLDVALRDKEFIDRHRDKRDVMEKMAEISKKTRFIDCF